MNRRELLRTGLLAAGAVSLPTRIKAQTTEGPKPMSQVPPIWRHRIGDRVVTVVSDGYVPFEDWHSPNIDPAERARILREHFLPTDIYQGSINTFVVDDGKGSVCLVDAGAGRLLGSTSGHLIRNLNFAGYAPEDITVLLATHLHPDHVGGAYDADGMAVFRNAELVVSEADHAFWTDDRMQAQASSDAKFLWDIAADALSAYAGRVRRFEGEAEVLPGITPLALPGHTPGQHGFIVSDADDVLFIWADVIHFPPLQLQRPEVAFAFDVDPDLAIETRRRTLDMAAADRLQIAGMHMPFPGAGHVVRDGNAYGFIPSRWGYDL